MTPNTPEGLSSCFAISMFGHPARERASKMYVHSSGLAMKDSVSLGYSGSGSHNMLMMVVLRRFLESLRWSPSPLPSSPSTKLVRSGQGEPLV